jgi:hypothetical protein
MKLLYSLLNLFAKKPPVSELEKYLNKQEIHTTADIEFYIKKFDEENENPPPG